MDEVVFSVSDFVAVLNQTLEYAYSSVVIVGELSNLRVSKGRWVYFDLKDEYSSVKFFGTVQQLPGPLEDGMVILVRGVPRLHNLYGFSVNVQFMQPVGEGSLRKAADLLQAKLSAEGLFDISRKRPLPYPPRRIGLITSGESAAYRDFVKILDERWGGVEVLFADVQVQGEPAIAQVVAAITHFNTSGDAIDVLVITRGGGSADDLAVFNTEQVTRAVAASRIPTIVAIGHEIDTSLAELAADQRASTPSNAAQLLVPDKKHETRRLREIATTLEGLVEQKYANVERQQHDSQTQLQATMTDILQSAERRTNEQATLLEVLSPTAVLRRGYAVVRSQSGVIRSVAQLSSKDHIVIQFADGQAPAEVQ